MFKRLALVIAAGMLLACGKGAPMAPLAEMAPTLQASVSAEALEFTSDITACRSFQGSWNERSATGAVFRASEKLKCHLSDEEGARCVISGNSDTYTGKFGVLDGVPSIQGRSAKNPAVLLQVELLKGDDGVFWRIRIFNKNTLRGLQCFGEFDAGPAKAMPQRSNDQLTF